MSIFFLVVAVLVAAILLSRLTWWPAWGERRSVKHHEQAMDVLRSLAGRRVASGNGGIAAGEHPTISPATHIGPAAVFDEIPPAASAAAGHEMVRLLKEEPPPAKLPAPPTSLPPAPAAVAPVGRGADEKKATVEPSFVFFAEDSDDDLLAPIPALPSPPSIEDVTRSPSSRSRELVLAVLQMDRPRLGLAFGLITVVVMATVLGTLVALMSGSSNSQRVRQVAAPPTTIAAPAPSPPTTSSPVTTEPPPSTTVLPTPSTTTPTTSAPRPVRTFVTTPPSTTTPPTTAVTSPPTTSTPASVVSSTPPTTSPPPTTPTTRPTTTTTSPTTTTTKP